MRKYEDYRRDGHGPFVAATLSTHPFVFYAIFAVVGLFAGWIL